MSKFILNQSSEGQFKLVDSSGSEITSPEVEGLLIYNGGTVCGHDFDYYSAHAICKQMGFDRSEKWRSGDFFSIQNGYQFTLDDVRCNTGNWSYCCYRTNGHDCSHQEDVLLTCGSGRLKFKLRRSGLEISHCV